MPFLSLKSNDRKQRPPFVPGPKKQNPASRHPALHIVRVSTTHANYHSPRAPPQGFSADTADLCRLPHFQTTGIPSLSRLPASQQRRQPYEPNCSFPSHTKTGHTSVPGVLHNGIPLAAFQLSRHVNSIQTEIPPLPPPLSEDAPPTADGNHRTNKRNNAVRG